MNFSIEWFLSLVVGCIIVYSIFQTELQHLKDELERTKKENQVIRKECFYYSELYRTFAKIIRSGKNE
jgi:hypothetical protein